MSISQQFAQLKQSSKAGGLEQKFLESMKAGQKRPVKGTADDRLWAPTPDKAGNAKAVFRFLPALDENDPSYVRIFSYGFQHSKTGMWYIENSLTTLGLSDPMAQYNNQLYNSNEEGKKQASYQKRQQKFYANIYMIKDYGNPENDGKVFLYKYGKRIHDKIEALASPAFADDPIVVAFDLFKGANFNLVQTMQMVDLGKGKKAMPSYDNSFFSSPGPLMEDEEKLERIWRSQYPLKPLIDPMNKEMYKSYDDLKRRCDQVTGTSLTENTSALSKSKITKAREKEIPFDNDKDDDDEVVDQETADFLKKIAEEN